jgi:hypothetical protein
MLGRRQDRDLGPGELAGRAAAGVFRRGWIG